LTGRIPEDIGLLKDIASITLNENLLEGQLPTSLMSFVQSFWRNRHLIVQMTKREVVGRYKGSVMGLAWSFFNPVFMLLVYTFVFSVIFKSDLNFFQIYTIFLIFWLIAA
jgi:ABC-type polysaccharide/polyol phosphate export permease